MVVLTLHQKISGQSRLKDLLVNMLISFFHLNAFFPLHLSETVVEYIYNKKLGV